MANSKNEFWCSSTTQGLKTVRVLQSHHQLQDPLDVGLATQAFVHTYVSMYNKVIICCRVH